MKVLVSLFFIVTMLVGGKTNQLAALGIYLCWEILLVLFYKYYRKSKDGKWVFYLVSFLSLLPIIFVEGAAGYQWNAVFAWIFGNFLPDLSFGWDYHRAERWSD